MEKSAEYKVVNGTYYGKETSAEVIEVLEKCRKSKTRIVLDYGDVNTGVSYEEVYGIKGTISRSCGEIKIPILLMYSSRSIGGVGIATSIIIGIKESKGGKVLYSWSEKRKVTKS